MNPVRRVLLAVPLLVLLWAPAQASAILKIPFVAGYNVEYSGHGTYSVKGGDNAGNTTNVSSTFHWDVHYQPLLIVGKGGQPLGAGVNTKKAKAGGEWQIASTNADGTNCSSNGGLKLGDLGGLTGRVQKSGSVNLTLDPSESDFDTTGGEDSGDACSTSDFWHDWVVSFSHVGSDSSNEVNPLAAFIRLSKSDLRHGKIIEHVSNHTLKAPSLSVDGDCGSGAGSQCTQTYSWTGTVTLKKTQTY